jgi:hypothetical protein
VFEKGVLRRIFGPRRRKLTGGWSRLANEKLHGFIKGPIIIIIIITIFFMQGIYAYLYIPETNNVPKEYNVPAILSLLFMVPISLVPVLTL